MPNPFKIRIPLSQHTPLLQFQLEQQQGATLRGTELVPRINQFIREDFRNERYPLSEEEKGVIKKYFIPKDPKKPWRTPYQLRVIIRGKDQHYLPAANKQNREGWMPKRWNMLPYSPFFANSENLNHNKKSNRYEHPVRLGVVHGEIELEIGGFNPTVNALVAKAIPYVLAYHNFGTRQSKGFGCFTTRDMTREEFEAALRANPDFIKVGKMKLQRPGDMLGIMDQINRKYKLLKNLPAQQGKKKGYNRSKLKAYYQSRQVEWEKEFVSKKLAQGKPYHTGKDPRYVRALFGVAELYDYPQLKPKNKVKVKISSKKIERFRSPLMFKVFGEHLYLIATEIPGELFGAKFKFEGPKGKADLETPDKGTFSWSKFFNSIPEWQQLDKS